jgi:putative NADH-flavin reductase
MKLAIFAATGGIGRLILDQAIAAGHDVTAIVRNPAKLPAGVDSVAVDLAAADPAVIEAAIAGSDAILSGLGAVSKAETGVATRGTKAIIQAMKAADVRRIVVVSAAPIGTMPSPHNPNPPKHDPGDGFVMRHVLSPMIKTILRQHYTDLAMMEDALVESGLDWTIIRPPQLTDKPLTGTYRTAYGQNLRGGTKISRADVAHLMLQVLQQRPEAVKSIMGVAY